MSEPSLRASVLPAAHQPKLPVERVIRAEAAVADAVPMDVVFVGGGPAGPPPTNTTSMATASGLPGAARITRSVGTLG